MIETQEELLERLTPRVPYPVNPERVAKAEQHVKRCLAELSPDDVAGIMGECGLWDCVDWFDFSIGKITLNLSDLQMVAAAAALASALDHIQYGPIEIETITT